MVTRTLASLVLFFMALGASADGLVPRVVDVTWEAPANGPASAFMLEVLRTDLAGGAFLVAEPNDAPDAHLAFTLTPDGLQVTFRDEFLTGRDWKEVVPVTGRTSAAVWTAAETLAPRWTADLVPLPPRVREVVTQKVVQETVVEQTQKGVTLTFAGRPGTRLVLTGGAVLVLDAEGKALLSDQVQGSSLVVDATLPGYFPRRLPLAVGTADLTQDVTLVEAPRWSVAVGTGQLQPFSGEVRYRLGTGNLSLVGLVSTTYPASQNTATVTAELPNPLGLPLGSLFQVHWVQLEAGALWLGSAPQDLWEWGFQGGLSLRADRYATGWELSRWFVSSAGVDVLGGVHFGPSFSLDVRLGALLSFARTDPKYLELGGSTEYHDYAVTKLGYVYQEAYQGLVQLGSTPFYLRYPDLILSVSYWF